MARNLKLTRRLSVRWRASAAMTMAIVAQSLFTGVEAHAQTAVQGTLAPGSGATITTVVDPSIASGFTDRVVLGNRINVLNWTPTDTSAGTGPINFLPANNGLVFFGGSFEEFAVLNRIVPTGAASSRGIALNGVIRDFANAGGNAFGNIWFYSPNGILFGPNSNVAVTGLFVSTIEPNQATLFAPLGSSNFATFSGITNPASAVEFAPGASITASNFIGVAAPRIVQGGTLSSRGGISLAAGEEVSFSLFGSSLFGEIFVGTNDQNGIVHLAGANTGGNAQSPNSTIQFVAAAKNTAITMLLGGTVGHTNAVVDDRGTVSISASSNGTTNPANIIVNNTRFRSNTFIDASGTLNVAPVQGAVTFETDASLAAFGDLNINIANGASLFAGGNLDLRSFGLVPARNVNVVVGGDAEILGTFTVNASDSLIDRPPAPVFGGSARISVNGGRLRANNLLILSDTNLDPGTSSSSASAGAAGIAELTVNNGGSIILTGGLGVSAVGRGLIGGSLGNGTTTMGGDGGEGGAGIGGTARLSVSGAGSSLTVGGNFNINAGALGGPGGDGENGPQAPSATAGGNGGRGGAATGGIASVTIADGASLTLNGANNQISATVVSGAGGAGGQGNGSLSFGPNGQAGQPGQAQGGNASLTVAGGTFSAGQFSINAGGIANTFTTPAAPSRGGSATLSVRPGSVSGQSNLNIDALDINASGAIFGSGAPVADGIAGTARIENLHTGSGSNIVVNSLNLTAQGTIAGAGGVELDLQGSGLTSNGGATLSARDDIRISATGTGLLQTTDDLTITAGQDVVFNHSGRAASGNTILAPLVNISAGRNIVTTGGLARVTSNRVNAQNAINLTAAGEIEALGLELLTTASDTSIGIASGNDIRLGAVNAGDTVNTTNVTSGNGRLFSNGSIEIAGLYQVGNGNVDLEALGNVSVGEAVSPTGSSISLRAGQRSPGPLVPSGAITAGRLTSDSNITLLARDNIFVEHAESRGFFRATGGRFETGLNSIISGADITINTAGDSILGNSSAQTFITVNTGGAISYNQLTTLTAIGDIGLSAGSTITGGNANSGQSFAAASAGNLAIGNTTAAGSIIINSRADATLGTSTANGNAGTVGIPPVIGNVFVIASGTATLGQTTAQGGIGVRGNAVVGNGPWASTEGTLAIADTTAQIASISSGDDIDVIAPGGITLGQGAANGGGRQVVFSPGDPNPANFIPPSFFLGTVSGDGGDIRLTSAGGPVSSTNLTAGDDINITAGGLVTVSGLARTLGTAPTGGASDIIVISGSTAIAAGNAANTLSVTTTGAAGLGASQAGLNILVNAGGAATFTSLQSGVSTSVIGNTIAGGQITSGSQTTLSATNGINVAGIASGAGISAFTQGGDLIVDTATSAEDISYTNRGNGLVSTTSTTSGGSLSINAGGNVQIGSAAANGTNTAQRGDLFIIAGGSVAADTLNARNNIGIRAASANSTGSFTAGEDAYVQVDAIADLNSVTAGDDIDVIAPGGVNLATGLTTGLAGDATRVEFSPGLPPSNGPFFQAVTTANDGDDIRLNSSGGPVSAANLTAGDDINITAAGVATVSGLARTLARAPAVGGPSNIDVTAGTAAITASNAAANLTVTATGAANLGVSQAGTDIASTSGGAMSFQTLQSGGATRLSGNSITGGSINATGLITLAGTNGININSATTGSTLTTTNQNGRLRIGTINASGAATLINFGTGLLESDSATAASIAIIARGNVTLGTTNANGAGATSGNLSLVALGDVTIGNTQATNNIGIAGNSINGMGSVVAGADAYFEATSTASLNSVQAGDDIDVIAPGGITLTTAVTTGAAGDGTRLVRSAFIPALPPALGIFTPQPTAPDGNDIRLTSTGGPISTTNLTAGDDIAISAGGAVTISGLAQTQGTAPTGGASNIDITAPSTQIAGSNAFNDLNVTTTGIAGLGTSQAGNAISVNSGGASFTALTSGTSTTITSTGAVTGGGTANAGTTLSVSGTSITTGNGTATGAVSYLATNGSATIGNLTGSSVITSSTGLTTTGTLLATSGNASVTGETGITTGTISSPTGSVLLANPAGTIQTGQISSANGFTLNTPSALNVAGVTSANGVIAITTTAAASVGNLSASSAGSAINVSGASVTAGNSNASTSLALQATGGDLTAGNSTAGTALSLGATGNLSTGNSSGASISATAGQNLTFGGTTTSTGTLTATAGLTALINANATGTNIAVSSADIVISPTARLGTLGTTAELTLTNNGTSRTTIGGNGTTGYSLSAAELARLTANNIAIVAPVIGGPASTAFNSARAPDVVIEAFTLAAGTNFAANGGFTINTRGKMRVTGAVSFTGLGGNNAVSLTGDEAIEILDAGSIILNGATGLAGQLNLNSRNVVAAPSASLAGFASAANLTALSDLAGQSVGPSNDGGYLQADTIRVNLLGSTFIVQNTGTGPLFADRRGLTVGAGGLFVTAPTTSAARIAINGQIRNQTGLNAIPLLFINGQGSQSATGFDPLSTMNGCQINAIGACRARQNPTNGSGDNLFGPGSQGGFGIMFPSTVVELKDFEIFGYPPLIDEPITGSGNDDLWTNDCTPGEGQTCGE